MQDKLDLKRYKPQTAEITIKNAIDDMNNKDKKVK
jgi:hypothetical protein